MSHNVSLVSHTSHIAPHASFVALVSESQVQGIRKLLRFICGQLLLRCQVALVLNEELVDTVGDILVDPRPSKSFTLLNDSVSVTS